MEILNPVKRLKVKSNYLDSFPTISNKRGAPGFSSSSQFYIRIVVCVVCEVSDCQCRQGPVFVYKSYNINTVTDLFSVSNNTAGLLSPFKY